LPSARPQPEKQGKNGHGAGTKVTLKIQRFRGFFMLYAFFVQRAFHGPTDRQYLPALDFTQVPRPLFSL